MTNNKIAKKALFSSVIALFFCFTMFIGTTFAWFTDSVTSGSNVITSGNLDFEVQYTLDGENWEDLDGAEDLFQKGSSVLHQNMEALVGGDLDHDRYHSVCSRGQSLCR